MRGWGRGGVLLRSFGEVLMDPYAFLNFILWFEVLFSPEAPVCSYPDGCVCVVTGPTPVNGAFFLITHFTHFWASLDWEGLCGDVC